MPATVEFDAASLADAVSKASKVAPTKGAAFDKAAGILFDITADVCVVTTTNTDVSYKQSIPVASFESDDDLVRWRISSTLLSNVAASLKMDHEQTVKFIDRGTDRMLRMKQGTFMAAFPILRAEDFPRIDHYEMEGMSDGTDFSVKVGQVAWACKTDPGTPLQGVHMDGKDLFATDGYLAAVVPCVMPVPEGGVTAPLRELAPLLRSATDVRLRATDRHLQIALDAETQATSLLFQGQFPDVRRIMRYDTLYDIMIPRVPFTDMLQQMLMVVSTEKTPALKMMVDYDALEVIFDITTDHGRVQNRLGVEIPEPEQFANYDPEDMPWVTIAPRMILDAIGNSRAALVQVGFDKQGAPAPNKVTVVFTDGSGYEVHGMPIVRETKEES